MKKFAVSLLTLAFLTLSAGAAIGAPDPAKLQELKGLHQQAYELRVQIIDKQVEAGLLNQEKATQIKQSMEQHQKKMLEDMANGKYDFGRKHGKRCEGQCKRPSEPAPETKSSPNAN